MGESFHMSVIPGFTFALGMKRFPAGRLGDHPSIGLSASLNAAGFSIGRLQTGTPARLDRRTIDFTNLVAQLGDIYPSPFSFLHDKVDNAVRRVLCKNLYSHMIVSIQNNQVACHQTHTTPETHQIVRDNMHLSCHIQETRKGLDVCTYEPIGF